MEKTTTKHFIKDSIEHTLLCPISDIIKNNLLCSLSSHIQNIEYKGTVITLDIISSTSIDGKKIDIVKSTAVYFIPNELIYLCKESEKHELITNLYLDSYESISNFIYSESNGQCDKRKTPPFEYIYREVSTPR